MFLSKDGNMDTLDGDSYETSDGASKGIVSGLTNVVNFMMKSEINDDTLEADDGLVSSNTLTLSPSSPEELLRFIEEDYTRKNYLWTGDIHLPAFEEDCRFTDPTLSFRGTKQFVKNVKNLVPIVNWLTKDGTGCRSDLLDISLNEKDQYIQSRWNMVGDLSSLPWKPVIDVIGNTKFWYRKSENENGSSYRVYFYDEKWELKTWKALLQLVSRKGTIPNSD
jgi:hypothetical protein